MSDTIKNIEEITGKSIDKLWEGDEPISLGGWVKAEDYDELKERLAEAFTLIQGWLNAEDEPRHAPPNLIPRSIKWLANYGRRMEGE